MAVQEKKPRTDQAYSNYPHSGQKYISRDVESGKFKGKRAFARP